MRLRPAETGGLADYTDLADGRRGAGRRGADFVGLNPIHAGSGAMRAASAPTRRPTAAGSARFTCPMANARTRQAPDRLRRRDRARRQALERAYRAFAARPDPAFDAFVAAGGGRWTSSACTRRLSDRFGPFWNTGPRRCKARQRPRSPPGAGFRGHDLSRLGCNGARGGSCRGRMRERRDAGMGVGLYLDLAVGTHPHGAETWEDRDSFRLWRLPRCAARCVFRRWAILGPRAVQPARAGGQGLPPAGRDAAVPDGAVGRGADRPHPRLRPCLLGARDGAPGAYVQMPRARCWPSCGWRPRARARWWWARTSATCRAACAVRWRPRASSAAA
jgi:hypothetical protein